MRTPPSRWLHVSSHCFRLFLASLVPLFLFTQCFLGNQCLEEQDCPSSLRCERGLCVPSASEIQMEAASVEPTPDSAGKEAHAKDDAAEDRTSEEPVVERTDSADRSNKEGSPEEALETNDSLPESSDGGGGLERNTEDVPEQKHEPSSPESVSETGPEQSPVVCDALASDQAPLCRGWALRHDTNVDYSGRELERMAIDSLGNVYMVGGLVGTRTYGQQTLVSKGNKDILVVKIDPTGKYVWAKQFGGTGNESARSVIVDSSNNLYITGNYESKLVLGTNTLVGGNIEAFVAKLDSSGIPQWSISAGGSSTDVGQRLAIDNLDQLYWFGTFSSTATFGTFKRTSSGENDLFVAKLSSTGSLQWVSTGGGKENEYAGGIAVDSLFNVYIAGAYRKSANFGTINLSHGSLTNILIAKLNPKGDFVWAKGAGKNNFEQCNDIAVDAMGNSYVSGFFRSSSIRFGTSTLTTFGDTDGFVAKLNTKGDFLWAKRFGGSTFDQGTAITLSSTNHVYITGFYQKSSTFGATTLSSPGKYSVFVSKLNDSGAFLWSRSAGGSTGRDEAHHLVMSPPNFLLVNGYFSGTVKFGATSLTSKGNSDGFLWKLSTLPPP